MSQRGIAEVLRALGQHEQFLATRRALGDVELEEIQSFLEFAAELVEKDQARFESRQVVKAVAAPPTPAPKPAAAKAPPREAEAPKAARAAPGGAVPKRVRVFSDGASRGNPGPSGAGAVLVDGETGEEFERLKRFLGSQTNNVAEYEAALLGLARAKELGIPEVELVADSQLLIRQLGGQYQVKHPNIRPLYEQAVRLLKGFAKVRLVHVPRELNKAADEMSNRAIDER